MLSAEHPLDPVVKYLQRKLTILSNHHVFYLSKYISIFSEPLVKKIVKSFNALKSQNLCLAASPRPSPLWRGGSEVSWAGC